MDVDAKTIVTAVTQASELVLVIAAFAFVRMYFVPEYGFFVFAQRNSQKEKQKEKEKEEEDCTVQLLLFSAEHIAPLDPPVFRVCLRALESVRINSVDVYAGAWLNEKATCLVRTSTGSVIDNSDEASGDVELVLVLRGMAPAGAVKIVFGVSTPGSTSGEVPIDVDVYSVSGYARKGAADVVKERAGLPVRRFDAKSRKFGRTFASLMLGLAIGISMFVYFRLQLIPKFLEREAIVDKVADLSVWDIGLMLVLLIFALEFALHRLIAGYPFRSTACGYRRKTIVWSRES